MTYPTQFAYDVLGRLRQEQHSDNGMQAMTTISYQMGTSPTDGRTYIVKITTDPLYANDHTYHYRTEYQNTRDDVTLVRRAEPDQRSAATNLYTTPTPTTSSVGC